MAGSATPTSLWVFPTLGMALFVALTAGPLPTQPAQEQSTSQKDKPSTVLPRGQKLILKDGSFQVIREYQRNGDRVRYFSLERDDWEEIPASMIDWGATAKAAGDAEKAAASMVEKIHKQEEARRMDNVMDVDASLQVGDGVFLPAGEGMFVVEGKSVRLLDQAGSQVKTDKIRAVEKVLSPIPIVPGKQNVVLSGAHASLRIRSKNPEFYLREAPPDPERASPVVKSSRPGETGPEVELLRVKVGRNTRHLESISTLFGEQISEQRDSISVQRWEIAPTVYRFTLSEPLPPGEYVLAELLPDGLNFFVWDFGVDAAVAGASK
jgi:hypothetical protein